MAETRCRRAKRDDGQRVVPTAGDEWALDKLCESGVAGRRDGVLYGDNASRHGLLPVLPGSAVDEPFRVKWARAGCEGTRGTRSRHHG
jgi:hypothetical protein